MIAKIGWILGRMHAEASKRGAPVFDAEEKTEGNPFKILVFTMLSARTKDSTTINAVEKLFSRARTPEEIASLGSKRLEKLLYGVGFYRVKAKNLQILSEKIAESGGVPSTLEGLLALPGIGRKTANIILARAYGKSALGVDVHVHRISNRLGLVKTKKPEDTEKALVRIIPKKHLRSLNRNFVAFGQTVCLPRKPLCSVCPLNQICRRVGVREPCAGCRY
ncbi:MAG TPA: endonuclease III [Candidatus Bilamarchaeum sp.]|nr:endonuclease III [Candidatus Bilamarchaeum sp.]